MRSILRAAVVALLCAVIGVAIGASIGFYLATLNDGRYSYRYRSGPNTYWSEPAVGVGLGGLQGGGVGLAIGVAAGAVIALRRRI